MTTIQAENVFKHAAVFSGIVLILLVIINNLYELTKGTKYNIYISERWVTLEGGNQVFLKGQYLGTVRAKTFNNACRKYCKNNNLLSFFNETELTLGNGKLYDKQDWDL